MLTITEAHFLDWCVVGNLREQCVLDGSCLLSCAGAGGQWQAPSPNVRVDVIRTWAFRTSGLRLGCLVQKLVPESRVVTASSMRRQQGTRFAFHMKVVDVARNDVVVKIVQGLRTIAAPPRRSAVK